jgi:competence protein ComEA
MNKVLGIRQSLIAILLLSCSGFCWSAVNINTADAKTIAKELDGVGDKMSAAIVKEREKAPFTSIDDVDKRIKGWGKKISERNKDKIKFSDK